MGKMIRPISRRLPGFDYSQPFFYMVTLKRRLGMPALSELCGEEKLNYCRPTELTPVLSRIIRTFHAEWPIVAPIECYTIMPDHIHLLIRLTGSSPLTLPRLVWLLRRKMEQVTGMALLENEWHDWIVQQKGQLPAFTRYIRENPKRAWFRRLHARYFRQLRTLPFCGARWHAYGNMSLLELPVLVPFRCSRAWREDGPEWRGALLTAARIGPGCAGISTFMSPCEKSCGNVIVQTGGACIILMPEGFGDRWHPPRAKEELCAFGRMLFLSLYEPSTTRLDNATLYRRCHEMGNLILSQNEAQ